MVTFFDMSSKQRGVSRLSLFVVAVISATMGATFAMSQASASTENAGQASASSVSAKGSFRTAVCERTYASNGGWKYNGYGLVAVQSGSTYVDLVRRNKAGKLVSTRRIPANTVDSFRHYAPDSAREANYQLRASDGRYITQRFTAPVCYR